NTAGSYDQDNVTGTVTLGGATLNLTSFGGYVPQSGDIYILIANDGIDAVTGTFVAGTGIDAVAAGTALAEGALLSTNFLGSGLSATITYMGGDSNDVQITLAQTTVIAYVDDTWTGTAPGTSPANAPVGGLVFGTNAFADIQSAIDHVADNG